MHKFNFISYSKHFQLMISNFWLAVYVYISISILYNKCGIFTGIGKPCRFFFLLHAHHGFVIQIVDSANCRWTYAAGELDIMWNPGERIAVDRAIFSTFATSNYLFFISIFYNRSVKWWSICIWCSWDVQCVLASIIVVALKGMLTKVTEFMKFWRLDKTDAGIWAVTFIAVILFDVEYGLLVGVLMCIGKLLVLAMRPYTCKLALAPGTELYLDSKRYKGVRRTCNLKKLLFLDYSIFIITMHIS